MIAIRLGFGMAALGAGTIAAIAADGLRSQGPSATSATRGAYVAALLADADRAAASGARADRKTLAARVAVLDQLSVRSQDDGDDAVAGWRTLVGGRAAPAYRGRLLGPAYRRGWLDTGREVQVEQLFVSGQPASVSVATVPDAKVRLGVTGPDSAAACAGDQRQCSWVPLFTQRYTITLRNLGPQRARFYLVVD